jgi:anti-sigma factor RsiW
VDGSCHDVLVVIDCYVDGECDLDTALAIAAHLDVCCECGARALTIRLLKARVRRCMCEGQNHDPWHSFRTHSA